MADRMIAVAPGDTLWGIAKHNLGAGHRWPEIYAVNKQIIKNPNLIHIGQTLRIPDASRFGVSDPHPLQRERPQIAPLTMAASSHPHASVPTLPTHGNNPIATTTVNNPTAKFDLNLVPPVVQPFPGGIAKLSWTGQVFIWKDGQRPLDAVGNKGAEMSQKREMASVLGELLESRKLSVSPNHIVTYEDLMGVVSYGSPGTVVSSGVVMTSASPFPVYRTQVKTKLRQGKLRNWLFSAVDMTINFDLEIVPQTPGASPGLVPVAVAHAAPAPYQGRIASDPTIAPTALQQVGAWTRDHKEAIAVAVVGASIVVAFLTLGGSAALEGAGALIAARLATAS